ncbi:MAG: NarK family nitrate/nitrite MFS transporter [Chromatiaceae bacterium]|nr:NarK family nitrate/nitrite MFS transporter [Chromatiaceae bacterium]MCP5434899.1 NarK family nitrate/nitrite MFS transporter [Chromatiaceae bacterium]
MSEPKLNLLSFEGKIRTLHLTWFAFFISFAVWFNHAPLLSAIQETFGLSKQEVKALLIINVALTIPARIIIGMLVDKYGPRIMYSSLLFISSWICFIFAMADSYQMLLLSRFMLGFVGAGFVIGIRMIGEWFPARQVGVAEGIYGGWGNFGSAAAAMSLPTVALWYGGDEAWRYAVATTGVIALVYSLVYFKLARNTPKGSTYFKPKKTGAMEITSKGDFFFYLLMNIPMYLALAVLNWKLGPANLGIISDAATTAIYVVLVAIYAYQTSQVWRINKHVFSESVPEIHRYSFKQVAILDVAYFVTFGSELAVVSMLPLFFKETFDLSLVQAGLLASGFAFMNLIARPTGGLFSDRFGRKHSLSILVAGLAIGYYLLSNIDSSWPIWLAVAATMACSFFVQAGEGAVFAVVPLVKRRMTGQIAGMAGAYGNVGAVTFLTAYSFMDASSFFLVIASAAIIALIAIQFMDEPSGQTAEVLEDGTVQMIDVS